MAGVPPVPDLGTIWALQLPPAATIGAAIVSVVAAVGSAALAYASTRQLEKLKAGYQEELERTKATLQAELEAKKLVIQKELEDYKVTTADDISAINARRAYEYEARKRLYSKVEPLLFQLFESAENAFHAVGSLVRTQRHENLPGWLSQPAYYSRSITHRLFAPLVILGLIRRSTTFLDLALDPSIRIRYALLKECSLTWTDDFGIALLTPSLPYEPNRKDWTTVRKQDPARYHRQGILVGHLDRFVSLLITGDAEERRPVNYGEFEALSKSDNEFRDVYSRIEDVFIDFDFLKRPVTARILLIYGCLLHLLMMAYRDGSNPPDLETALNHFLESFDRESLVWWGKSDPDVFKEIYPYLLDRLKQAEASGSYIKF